MSSLIVLSVVLSAATPAWAQGDPSPRIAQSTGQESHDGFYLHLGVGLGYLGSTGDSNGDSLVLSGFSQGLEVALGGAISRNLILFGQFTFRLVENPNATVDGASTSGSISSFEHVGVGPGVAYYVMPLNVYFSGALILGRVRIEDNENGFSQTHLGLGVDVAAGKELWMSDDWGLGVAFQLMFASNKGKDVTFSTLGAGLALSATYN